ncbi:unnamed protein product [Trichogramma brassicae]|uniref:Reverse transcriptase domain-containing protein n=1 Tax=Trichogramma brassicae TaxID=86971 RepID=A0A6H5ITI3_9HYME|nr:unnamed protein product [Trichogramma brassicae]
MRPEGPPSRGLQRGKPSCVLAKNEELTTIVTRPQAQAALWPGRSPRTADDENPPAQPQSLRGCPGPALRHHQQAAHRPTTRPSSSRSRTTGLRAGPRRAGATGGTPVLSMWTVSLQSCPAHRSLPGPRRIWRRASCPSSAVHVMPRCPRQILAAVVNRCTGGRPSSLDLRRSCLRARRLFQRSRGRHEETPQRELRLSKASSACGDQDQQASMLEAALRRGQQRRLGQTIQDCHVTPRMPAGQAAQLPSPGCAARWWRLCFCGCRAGPPCGCRVERRSLYRPSPWRNSKELSRGSEALRARPGWHTQLGALKIAIAARPDIFLRGVHDVSGDRRFPSGWKRQRLVLLPKPGKPPDEPSSYRPLCMLDTARARFSRESLCDRLEAFTERPRGLSERQYGFRKGRSTKIDAIEDVVSTAREAIAGKRWYRGTKKYCAVVTLDVRNAFNSARWDNILAALRRLLVPDYLLMLSVMMANAAVPPRSTERWQRGSWPPPR